MNKNFWNEQIEKHGKLAFLAPMDGYGDSAYRQSMKRIAPHIYCISEFYSADGLVHSKFLAGSVLPHKEIEKPLIVQIFGKDPKKFAEAAKIIESYGVSGIDINMGCPAKKVVRSGHGSSLLINEQTAFDIVKALDESTSLPVSVKTRLSFDGNQDLIAFAQGLQKAGAKLITIHGRTAKQAYTGKADFTNIYELKRNLDIPVICNGDVLSYTDGMKKVQNLDGFMIGRCSFGNPWCFLGENHLSDEEKKYTLNNVYQPTLEEMLLAMEFHASQLVATKGERKGSLEIRKHLVQYLKSFPGVKEYRKRLVTTESIDETKETINDIRTSFQVSLQKRPGLGEIS
ncbi:tRNA-dihydrouridine synthase family protein [Candidatus Gracilibacteria bacterium]|nr:tRNA-dihydrouridine synthase family protein [Candidatus Gracilibacteria bacterium]